MSGTVHRQGVGFFLWALVSIAFFGLTACTGSGIRKPTKTQQPVLEAMSVTWGANLKFEQNFFESFSKRNGIKTQYVPNSRLQVYRQLLQAHTQEPDILEVDVIWPPSLADDLLDLKPYLTEADRKAFVPALLENYMVRGRLVALPVYVDVGILYYRPELLEKYGFRKPPETWDELEEMAARIQAGERRAGDKDFWGYVWQGSATEGGTCNALEWQSSVGAGNFIEPNGNIHVRSPRFLNALRRSASWIGTISPPAEFAYREDDSLNIWDAGQTAFMRNWASGFNHVAMRPGHDRQHFAVAPLPAGIGGHRGAMGGMGIAVSKYAANRELAVKAALELTSESNDLKRQLMTEGIPTHTALLTRTDLTSRTLLLAVSTKLLDSLVARPSLITGEKYDSASEAYSIAVSSVLSRKKTPEAAMAELEKQLIAITGLPVARD